MAFNISVIGVACNELSLLTYALDRPPKTGIYSNNKAFLVYAFAYCTMENSYRSFYEENPSCSPNACKVHEHSVGLS